MTPEEVLNRHELAPWSDNHDWHCSPECGASGSMRWGDSHADHVLAALGVAGYAITKLPEPERSLFGNDDEWGVSQWWPEGGDVAAFDSGVVEFDLSPYHGQDTQHLRNLAAALLAAAAAAEENQ